MAICVLRGSIWYVVQPSIKKTIHLDTARNGQSCSLTHVQRFLFLFLDSEQLLTSLELSY